MGGEGAPAGSLCRSSCCCCLIPIRYRAAQTPGIDLVVQAIREEGPSPRYEGAAEDVATAWPARRGTLIFL